MSSLSHFIWRTRIWQNQEPNSLLQSSCLLPPKDMSSASDRISLLLALILLPPIHSIIIPTSFLSSLPGNGNWIPFLTSEFRLPRSRSHTETKANCHPRPNRGDTRNCLFHHRHNFRYICCVNRHEQQIRGENADDGLAAAAATEKEGELTLGSEWI